MKKLAILYKLQREPSFKQVIHVYFQMSICSLWQITPQFSAHS